MMNMNNIAGMAAEPSKKSFHEKGNENIVKTPEGFYTVPAKTISFEEKE